MKSILVAMLTYINVAQAQSINIPDAAGKTFSLPRAAQRVVSLAPHITELVYAVGAGDKLVGVVSFSNYPEQALQLPQVGNYKKFDPESILKLQPDLILAWQSGNPKPEIERLQKMGIPIYLDEPRALEEIAISMEHYGALLGKSEQAQQSATQFRQEFARLRKQYQARSKVRVFYQVWHEPMITLNGEHLISDVINGCGGENIFSDASALAPRVGVEAVLQRKPQVILTGTVDLKHTDSLDSWKKWQQLPAVKNQHLYYVFADHISRHTPRILLGMQKICAYLDGARP